MHDATVRIWTPESDYDAEAVACLARKIRESFNLNLQVRTSTKAAFNDAARVDRLRLATENYLKTDDLVIFLLDADGPQVQAQRRKEPRSLINMVEGVVRALPGKAHLILMRQELEAWLLVDVLGICCCYSGTSKNRTDKRWTTFAKSKQHGQTHRKE